MDNIGCCAPYAAAATKSRQSCPTLCDPIDGSPPGSHPWDSPGKNTGVGCHFLLQCMKVKSEREVTQSCPTLRDPMDCSPPGSSVHGIFQARALGWSAFWRINKSMLGGCRIQVNEMSRGNGERITDRMKKHPKHRKESLWKNLSRRNLNRRTILKSRAMEAILEMQNHILPTSMLGDSLTPPPQSESVPAKDLKLLTTADQRSGLDIRLDPSWWVKQIPSSWWV